MTLALMMIAGPARAVDLAGRWEGKFRCRWKVGRTIFVEALPDALLFISQSDSGSLHLLLPTAGYDGRLYVSQDDPDRGTIGAERCLNSGEPAAGLDDVVQMKFKQSRDTYVLNGSLTTGGEVDGPGRCSFRFKRVNTVDPNIPDCNP